MKRYRPKMFIEDPVTKEISTFEDYKIKHPYLGEDHIQIAMTEDSAGKWAEWEDVEKLLKKLKVELSKTQYIPECNCEANAREAMYHLGFTWICPAHGYKRK